MTYESHTDTPSRYPAECADCDRLLFDDADVARGFVCHDCHDASSGTHSVCEVCARPILSPREDGTGRVVCRRCDGDTGDVPATARGDSVQAVGPDTVLLAIAAAFIAGVIGGRD